MSPSARLLACCLLLTGTAGAQAGEADGRLAAFESQLEANPSATAVLQAWCDRHVPGTRIVARQVKSASPALSQDAMMALALKPGETVRYRRVQLMCANKVLSNAENWYLPDRLSAAMNQTLEHSETPFGVAVAALHFRRRNLETSFLPAGGPDVLRHSAVLIGAEGEPFSFVVESYTREILD